MSTLLLFAALSWVPLPAQTAGGSVETSQLEVRVEPGQIWRQNVQFESAVRHPDGSLSRWVFDYKLRLRCMSMTDGAFDVESFRHATRLWTIVLEISVLMARNIAAPVTARNRVCLTTGVVVICAN